MLLTCIHSKKRLMAWLCLEFCEETPEVIARNMAEIEARKDLFTSISFEKYTLGPNSTLVDNNLTEVSNKLVLMGVEAWPLLSSFPHPPEFIDWMRFVFQNPGMSMILIDSDSDSATGTACPLFCNYDHYYC